MTDNTSAISLGNRAMDVLLQYVVEMLGRELTQDEIRLAGSVVDFANNGGRLDFDTEAAAYKPGKRLGTSDRQVVEAVVRYLGATPAKSDAEKQRRAMIARSAFTV